MRALGRSAGVLQPKLLSKDEARRMAVNFAKREARGPESEADEGAPAAQMSA